MRFECSLPLAQCGLSMRIILSSPYSRPKVCKNCILVRPYLNSKNNNLVYLFHFCSLSNIFLIIGIKLSTIDITFFTGFFGVHKSGVVDKR